MHATLLDNPTQAISSQERHISTNMHFVMKKSVNHNYKKLREGSVRHPALAQDARNAARKILPKQYLVKRDIFKQI